MTYRPPEQPKYKTVAELQAAYKSGELRADETLMLDNDTTDAYAGEENVLVFSMSPDQVLEEALALLGIPNEHV